MFGKTPIPLLLVASVLYWIGLSHTIGAVAPSFDALFLLLPAILGLLLALPVWAHRLVGTVIDRRWAGSLPCSASSGRSPS